MKHFKLKEFFYSEVAELNGINNDAINVIVVENVTALGDYVLDPLRDMLKMPICIWSGYRTSELNDLLNGARSSQHLAGRAADIGPIIKRGSDLNYNHALKSMFDIISDKLDFDQLVYYPKRGFIHVSYVSVSANRHSIVIRR